MIVLARRMLAGVHALSGCVQWLFAFAFFCFAIWMVWPLGESSWLADLVGFLSAWAGVNCLRSGCEEILLNRQTRPPDPQLLLGRDDGRQSRPYGARPVSQRRDR